MVYFAEVNTNKRISEQTHKNGLFKIIVSNQNACLNHISNKLTLDCLFLEVVKMNDNEVCDL